MSQIGSFVPCDQCVLPIFDGIYTRIGAGDVQAEGISTFMNEMLDMSHIIKVQCRFLVLLMESCRMRRSIL